MAARRRWRLGRVVGQARPAPVAADVAAGAGGALAAVDRRSGVLVRPDAVGVPRPPRSSGGPPPLLRRRGRPGALVPRTAVLPRAGGRGGGQPRYAGGAAGA